MATSQDYLTSIQEKLERQNKKGSSKKLLQWKPDPNQDKQYIRILPYKAWPDPFIELNFHYGVGKYNMLCPEQTVYVGEKCPVCEYAEELRKTDWEMFRKVQAKLRVFVPVVERGKEFNEQGVPQIKFWGISKTTYMELLNTCADPDYGAIWDPETGTDLIIIYTPPDPKAGKQYGMTSAKPRRNASQLSTDPEAAQQLIEAVPEWTVLYDVEDEASIQKKLDEWLENVADEMDDGNEDIEASEHTPRGSEDTEVTEDILNDDSPASPKAKQSVSVDEVESRLKNVLGPKKKSAKK